MADDRPIDCPDCQDVPGVSRREFVRAIGGAALVGGIAPRIVPARRAFAAPTPSSPAETAVKRLYDGLKDTQRQVICLPWDDPKRTRINANWAITEPTIEEFFDKDQKVLIDEIFRGVTSGDGYERFLRQMDEDAGGFDQYHIAIFGEPGQGPSQWTLTGRHVTIRADGDNVPGAAFGGPIVYGHGAGDSEKGMPGNVFYYQTQKANEVFKALDGKQRERALVPKAPREAAVAIQGRSGQFPGLDVGALSSDQKELVESVIRVILAPYRESDIDEAVHLIKDGGGVDALHMAFFEAGDIGEDQEWDIWRLEGPTFVWHFRGAPHVHTYVNIAKKA